MQERIGDGNTYPRTKKQERVSTLNDAPKVAKINLFTCYHTEAKGARQGELDTCLEINEGNSYIDRIMTFSGRPRYDDFFTQTEKYPHDINIFANADIYFNDTIKYMNFIRHGECYALTRWEEVNGMPVPFQERHTDNRYARPEHSQDVWAFRGTVKGTYGGFYSGIPGCDNRIAAELMQNFRVLNPSKTIQCVHLHESAERSYNIPNGELAQVPKPWKWVFACGLTTTGEIKDMDTNKPHVKTRGAV